MTVESIHVYPVKGLGGCALASATVGAHGLRDDRRFGIAFADSAALAALLQGETAWRPWEVFVSLKKYDAAAKIQARTESDGEDGENGKDGENTRLILRHRDGGEASGNPRDDAERRRLEEFLQDALQSPALRLIDSHAPAPTPTAAAAPRHAFSLWDELNQPMSAIALASLAALEADAQVPAQAARYRANLSLAGGAAWQEENWRPASLALRLGAVRLTPAGGIPRCAATRVNPQTATKDCNPPQRLVALRGHNEFGVFLQVAAGGEISRGMEISLEPSV